MGSRERRRRSRSRSRSRSPRRRRSRSRDGDRGGGGRRRRAASSRSRSRSRTRSSRSPAPSSHRANGGRGERQRERCRLGGVGCGPGCCAARGSGRPRAIARYRTGPDAITRKRGSALRSPCRRCAQKGSQGKGEVEQCVPAWGRSARAATRRRAAHVGGNCSLKWLTLCRNHFFLLNPGVGKPVDPREGRRVACVSLRTRRGTQRAQLVVNHAITLPFTPILHPPSTHPPTPYTLHSAP